MPALTADRGEDLLTRLISLETEHAALCPATKGGSDLQSTVDLIAKELHAAAGNTNGASQQIEVLNHLLFGRLGIKGSPDLKDPCNLLPSRVHERKQGYCVGIAALYLSLAERLQLPVYAMATPSHVFLRYDDGTTRINIETLQSGANVSDERYILEQKIPEESDPPRGLQRDSRRAVVTYDSPVRECTRAGSPWRATHYWSSDRSLQHRGA